MPELPEVHTISTDLNKHITGYEIKKVFIAKGYAAVADHSAFEQAVLNKTISSVRRVAKNIIVELSTSDKILFHLAMTGRLLLREPADRSDQWVKVLLVLEKNGDSKHLRFSDVRMFGKVKLISPAEMPAVDEKYGPEIIDASLTPEKFWEILQSKKTNIKNALLDQSLVSGLGNIYVTDALFMAKIHPETSTQKLTQELAANLLTAAREIITESIAHRGSTLPDKMYVDVFGKAGSHQNYFRIYMKQTCPSCGNKVSFIQLNGRGTYFCPVCQPKL